MIELDLRFHVLKVFCAIVAWLILVSWGGDQPDEQMLRKLGFREATLVGYDTGRVRLGVQAGHHSP